MTENKEINLELLSDEELIELLKKTEENIQEYDTFQNALKLLMNSLYGALSNRWFVLFNQEIARAITQNGRYFIRNMSDQVNDQLNSVTNKGRDYIIYNDTDSGYFDVQDIVDLFLAKNKDQSINDITSFVDDLNIKLVQPKVQEYIDQFAHELNAYDKSMIGAEREIISDASVFVAPKKYMMRVRDDEGKRFPEDDPDIKVQGLEVIKGGTPNFSKEHLMKAIPEILDGDELSIREYLRERKTEYLSYPLGDIAQSQGVSRVDYDLSQSGVPQGSRCAIVHNNYIKENNLDGIYNTIKGGDRIKKVFLIEPNIFGSNVIGYIDDNFQKEIPTEIIDYDKMFEKGFVNMLKLMTNPMNWNIVQETESLDDW